MRLLIGLAATCICWLFPLEQGRAQPLLGADAGPARAVRTAKVAAIDDPLRGRSPAPRAEPSAPGLCGTLPVTVSGTSPRERRLVCAAAEVALDLLGGCGIHPREPVGVRVSDEVHHPSSRAIFGMLDTRTGALFIVRESSVPALAAGTPYERLPPGELYRSIVVHEIVHAVMHQRFSRAPVTRAAHEYPAYALQLASLPADTRALLLSSSERSAAELRFNDLLLAFDPFVFAASAYRHYASSCDRCAHLRALLDGDAAFISEVPAL